MRSSITSTDTVERGIAGHSADHVASSSGGDGGSNGARLSAKNGAGGGAGNLVDDCEGTAAGGYYFESNVPREIYGDAAQDAAEDSNGRSEARCESEDENIHRLAGDDGVNGEEDENEELDWELLGHGEDNGEEEEEVEGEEIEKWKTLKGGCIGHEFETDIADRFCLGRLEWSRKSFQGEWRKPVENHRRA